MILASMSRSVLTLTAIVLVATACGGGRSASPERVVRAWSAALNASDNQRAANLFAPDAKVVQGNVVLTFHTHAEAVAWNAGLPCSGTIVGIDRHASDLTVTFLLGDRRDSPCDGPGQTARALVRVEHGKIVLWHQLATSAGDSSPEV
jgi:limonene-1,2-epoxide hydrolase